MLAPPASAALADAAPAAHADAAHADAAHADGGAGTKELVQLMLLAREHAVEAAVLVCLQRLEQ